MKLKKIWKMGTASAAEVSAGSATRTSGRHRKTLIALCAISAIALVAGGISMAFFSAREQAPVAADSGYSTIQTLIDDGTLVDTPPNEVWAEEESADGHGFTTRACLGSDVDSIGVLTIEKIGVSIQVYDSENTMEDMKKGASHYRASSYWDGNVCMAAHIGNASYSFFERLKELKEGDVVEYETTLGTRRYQVRDIRVIDDDDWSVIDRTEENCLTMTTCIAGRENQRLCVRAVEVVTNRAI